VIIIFIILKLRNQKITTIGFRRQGLRKSIALGVVLTVVISIGHIVRGKEFSSVIYNMIFYKCLRKGPLYAGAVRRRRKHGNIKQH